MQRTERVSWFILLGYFATWCSSYGWDFNHPIGIALDITLSFFIAWLAVALISHNRHPLGPDPRPKQLRPIYDIHNPK